jgi:hypothetical protein
VLAVVLRSWNVTCLRVLTDTAEPDAPALTGATDAYLTPLVAQSCRPVRRASWPVRRICPN